MVMHRFVTPHILHQEFLCFHIVGLIARSGVLLLVMLSSTVGCG